jgi:hypothetical protein
VNSVTGAIIGGAVGGVITLILLLTLLLRRRRLRNLSRKHPLSVLSPFDLREHPMVSQSQGPLGRLSARIGNFGRGGDRKRSRRGEMFNSARPYIAYGNGQVRNGHGNGLKHFPEPTQHSLQPPGSFQALISEDDALIQSIIRTIITQTRAHASESTHNLSPSQPPSSVDGPSNTHTNEEPTLVTGSAMNDRDVQLAGAIANLIRAFRRGGRESSGTAPPAYEEEP